MVDGKEEEGLCIYCLLNGLDGWFQLKWMALVRVSLGGNIMILWLAGEEGRRVGKIFYHKSMKQFRILTLAVVAMSVSG